MPTKKNSGPESVLRKSGHDAGRSKLSSPSARLALLAFHTESARALRGLWNYVRGSFGGRGGETNIGDEMAPALFPSSPAWARNTLMLLGMGRDRAGGTYEMRRVARRGYDRLHLAWNAGDGELHYHRVRTAMKRIAEVLGGDLADRKRTRKHWTLLMQLHSPIAPGA